jgi:hypothetical protein
LFLMHSIPPFEIDITLWWPKNVFFCSSNKWQLLLVSAIGKLHNFLQWFLFLSVYNMITGTDSSVPPSHQED